MELPKKFNNRPNDHVSYSFTSEHTGVKIKQNFFVSRSCAVVGIVFAITDIINVLLIRRSNKMVDEPNKVGIPLDWQETLHESMMREVYEETSFYMPDYEKYLIFDNNKQPFYVNDNPLTDKRQNVSHLYVNVYDFHDNLDKFPEDIQSFTCKETALVQWMNYNEFINTSENHSWAFNQDKAIKSAMEFVNKNMSILY